jgi:glyceraldehyde 3-phosphate dehydrogenase (phosphorylating)
VAVNEIGSLDNMVYLLKYDTVYGRYERQVEAVDAKLGHRRQAAGLLE